MEKSLYYFLWRPRCDQGAANRKAFFGRAAIDLPLDIKDRIDALDTTKRRNMSEIVALLNAP